MIELMPHQKVGAAHLGRRKSTLLKWDMGTGKTFATLAGWLNTGAGNMLILCPAVARRNWARELERLLLPDAGFEVEVVEDGKAPCTAQVVICSYDLARRPEMFAVLEDRDWDVMVLDELQYLKSPTSARSQAVFGSRRAKKFTRAGLAGKAERVWALSGTPAPNHVGELYNWVRFSRPELATRRSGALMNYNAFLYQYCKVQETPFGLKVIGNKKDMVQQLWAELDCSVIRKEDVLDLPPIRFEQLEVFGDRTAAQVRDLENEYAAGIADVLESIQSGNPPQHELATLRRYTEMAKVGDAIDLITPELQDGAMEKVVVFASHRDVIEQLLIGLEEFNPVTVHGGITGEARQEAIEKFSTDPSCRVFVGQTVAAGTAITLHADGACQDVIFLSADWVPSNNAQAAARVHRYGQTGSVFCRFLHLANSMDEMITRALVHKSRMLGQIYGEDKQHHAA